MRILSLAFAVTLTSLVSSAHATLVTMVTLGAQRTVVDALGATLGAGGSVWVGNFTSESFTFNPNNSIADNVTAISAPAAGGWKQFGLDTVTGNPDPSRTSSLAITAGKLNGSISDSDDGTTQAKYFDTRNLYIWVFDGASPALSTQMGIFRAPSVVSGNPWVFPTNANIGSNNVNISTSTTNVPTLNAIAGVGATPAGQLKLVAVTPVPEPSTFAFGIIGAFAALSSRHRRLKR